MNSTAVLEVVLFVAIAIALGLIHFWKDSRTQKQKMAAKEALRLDDIRQQAVKQLKIEQHAWSSRAARGDGPPAQATSREEMPVRT